MVLLITFIKIASTILQRKNCVNYKKYWKSVILHNFTLFKNNFASSHMDWTYDQKDIAEYYNLYFDLVKFWNKKLPNDIYNANYERIVQNKEIEIKKLIEFCGLKWDSACLNHHKHIKTPISTVSVVQARKPIYSSSLNSNNKYSKYLNGLYSSLKIE